MSADDDSERGVTRPQSLEEMMRRRNGRRRPDRRQGSGPAVTHPGEGSDDGGEEGEIPADLAEVRRLVSTKLGADVSFDVLLKDVHFAGNRALVLAIDGFVKDDRLQRFLDHLMYLVEEDLEGDPVDTVRQSLLGYHEVSTVDTLSKAVDTALSGPTVMFIDGATRALVIDVRTYPSRGPTEPALEKVLLGARDGFTETIVFNSALVRRRVRDPGFRAELKQVGQRSQTDVGLMYINDIASKDLVQTIRERLDQVETDGLPMGAKSLEEYIAEDVSPWNPFPTVRYTERPDVAAAHLYEGHVAVTVDTSPAVMLLPTTFFHHFQHAEEFHEAIAVGVMTRLARWAGALFTVLGVPLWVSLAVRPDMLPAALSFIGPQGEPGPIPLVLQFLIAFTGFQLIRLGLIHTPDSLATSLGIIGAVLLGEFTVQVGLFIPEVVLYAIVGALGTFVIPSFHMKNAARVIAVTLLVAGGLWGPWAVVGGALLLLAFLTTRTSFGVPYMYPLLPFDGRALSQVMIRRTFKGRTRRPPFLQPQDPDTAET